MPNSEFTRQKAIHDFQSARQRAAMQELLARLTGKSSQLLSYDEVAEKLKLRIRVERGLQYIPIRAIVGSVGRYADFTRTFLPRRSGDEDRWSRVKTAFLEEGAGLPPIDVYKVGEVYFVIDGNHRVSIAREEGATTIEARVIEVQTPVPLTPDIQPDDLIIKAEYAEFLNTTRIMDLRPNVDLSVTAPGQYEKLAEQICAQECALEQDDNSERSFQEAVTAWYDNVYIPLAETIRDRGLLQWFPNRTITDLYMWISENRSALEKELGWEIQSDSTATDLILPQGRSARAEPGNWRRARTVSRYTEQLFMDILVPLGGHEAGWDALEQAILIAQRDGANLHGLHIVLSKEMAAGAEARAVQARFEERCAQSNVHGNLVVESGDVTGKIRERAIMTDLIVMKIEHPPAGVLSALRSPFRDIITNSSRPVLAVPREARDFRRALLAYDGGLRAREALFVAAYLAEMWGTQLTVFTALQGTRVTAEVQDDVRRYLEIHEVEAEYIVSEEDEKHAPLRAAREHQADLVLMGGFGRSVLKEIVAGSTLDTMLRESVVPVFVCR
ncbi:MAG: universal stress protein [Chloroflexota bacterium]